MAANDKNGLSNARSKSSRLSLKGQRHLPIISPAPTPRSSHRIRNGNSDTEEKAKVTNSIKRNQAIPKPNSAPSLSEGSKCSNIDVKEPPNGISLNGFSLSGRAQGICPLANLGNTCFLNSVLYALRFLPGFAHDLHHLYLYLKDKSCNELSTSISERSKFVSELHNVFSILKSEEHSCVEGKRIPALQPRQFLESVRSINPQFEGNRQQDAHELLHWLLDQLNNLPQDVVNNDAEKLSPRAKRRRKNRTTLRELDISKNYDVVGSKFMGRMSLETRCMECETTNSREECFLEVCVPIKTKGDFDDDEEISSTEILLTALCAEDSLVGTNKYYCEFCSHLNEAKRFVHFKTLPHNLVIHVKRFSSYTARTFTTKCCDAMPAPFELPCFCQQCLLGNEKHGETNSSGVLCNGVVKENGLDSSVNKNTKIKSLSSNYGEHDPYFLSAFVCHLGATISSGHYISFIRISSRNSVNSCIAELESRKPNNDSNSNGDSKCSFLACCSSYLDKVLNSNNGSKDGVRGNSSLNQASSVHPEGFWLECDDEKIKVVSFAEVSSVMNSNTVTPYLLFYSR